VTAQRAEEISNELSNVESPRPSDSTWPVLAVEAPAIGLDCEGVRLGRFGRICVVQLAALDGRLFVLDALRPGVVEALQPLLESRAVAKVVHDCREDSAALFQQHGIRLRAVFDTQAAETVLLRHAGKTPHQVSFSELLRNRLQVEDPPDIAEVKTMMVEDARLWSRRPLNALLLRYVLHGVDRLQALRGVLLQEAAQVGGAALVEDIASASERSTDYCLLNQEFPTAASMAKIGTRLWAYVAAKTTQGMYFKLNAGRVGCVTTPSALSRFSDVELGDAVLCCVSGVSINGTYLFLDRYDPDWDYFDHQLRPSSDREVGAYGREHRYRTSVAGEDGADPLLVRGLPALELAEAVDAWEAGYEDLGLPAALDER